MPTRRAPPGYLPDLPAGCTLRFFQEGDEEPLLALLNAAFNGSWPRRKISVPPLEHLRWKLRSHDLAANLHVIAEQDGRIIAARPMWASPLKIDSRILLSHLTVDLAVLPEFQRHRVMTAMKARTPPERVDLFDVAVGVSNNRQSMNFIPGTSHERNIDVVVCPLDAEVPTIASAEWTIRRVDAFDRRVDDLWREASRSFRAIFVRTADRLNYRFADPRAGNYAIAIAEQGDRILGYIIYSSWQETGQIADVFVLPERLDVLESLLAYAIGQLRCEGNASAECWRFMYHPYRPVLEKLGFDQPRRTPRISMQWLNGQDDEMAFFADPKSAVHIMAGDTDLV